MATSTDDRKAQAQLGNAREQDVHHVKDQKGQNIVLHPDTIKPEATLYIKGCEDSEIVVLGKCTKIMIEGCRRTKVTLKGRILTNIVEVWKCADFGLTLFSDVKTLQLDICRNLALDFATRDHLGNIVWAGVYNLSIKFQDEPNFEPYVSGFDHMKLQYEDLNPIHDQFIVRNIKGEITSEQIVRLSNGYPTTEREAAAFDANKEQNEKNAEDFIRKRLVDAGITLGKKKAEGPKVGRNDPCTCGSGKKAKKCCHTKA